MPTTELDRASNITDAIPIPKNINANVKAARQATMLTLLGNPRSSYDQTCREVTDERLKTLIVKRTVGPLNVRGLQPAIESLALVLADIKTEMKHVYDGLGTAGMLCARLVRGSNTSISNHSWGTAIDLTLDGKLDPRGDDKVYSGLAEIAPIFNRHGWFWGAGFGTEDAMHFECGDALIRKWHADGLFGPASTPVPDIVGLGDRGPDVRRIQERLKALGSDLKVDGDFGPSTRAAVTAFQAAHGLTPDGAVGPKTLAALALA